MQRRRTHSDMVMLHTNHKQQQQQQDDDDDGAGSGDSNTTMSTIESAKSHGSLSSKPRLHPSGRRSGMMSSPSPPSSSSQSSISHDSPGRQYGGAGGGGGGGGGAASSSSASYSNTTAAGGTVLYGDDVLVVAAPPDGDEEDDEDDDDEEKRKLRRQGASVTKPCEVPTTFMDYKTTGKDGVLSSSKFNLFKKTDDDKDMYYEMGIGDVEDLFDLLAVHTFNRNAQDTVLGSVVQNKSKFFLDMRLVTTAPSEETHPLLVPDDDDIYTLPRFWQTGLRVISADDFGDINLLSNNKNKNKKPQGRKHRQHDQDDAMGEDGASMSSSNSTKSASSTYSIGPRSATGDSLTSNGADVGQQKFERSTRDKLIGRHHFFDTWEFWTDRRALSYIGFVASTVLARFNLLSSTTPPQIYYFVSRTCDNTRTRSQDEASCPLTDLRLRLVWQNVHVRNPRESYLLRAAIVQEMYSTLNINGESATYHVTWKEVVQQHVYTGSEPVHIVFGNQKMSAPCHFCCGMTSTTTKTTTTTTGRKKKNNGGHDDDGGAGGAGGGNGSHVNMAAVGLQTKHRSRWPTSTCICDNQKTLKHWGYCFRHRTTTWPDDYMQALDERDGMMDVAASTTTMNTTTGNGEEEEAAAGDKMDLEDVTLPILGYADQPQLGDDMEYYYMLHFCGQLRSHERDPVRRSIDLLEDTLKDKAIARSKVTLERLGVIKNSIAKCIEASSVVIVYPLDYNDEDDDDDDHMIKTRHNAQFRIPLSFVPCEAVPAMRTPKLHWTDNNGTEYPELSRVLTTRVQKLWARAGSRNANDLNLILPQENRHAELTQFLRDMHPTFAHISIAAAGYGGDTFRIPTLQEQAYALQQQAHVNSAIERSYSSDDVTGSNGSRGIFHQEDVTASASSSLGSVRSFVNERGGRIVVNGFYLLGDLQGENQTVANISNSVRRIKDGWHLYVFGAGSACCPHCCTVQPASLTEIEQCRREIKALKGKQNVGRLVQTKKQWLAQQEQRVEQQQRLLEAHQHSYLSMFLTRTDLYVACNVAACKRVYRLRVSNSLMQRYATLRANMQFVAPPSAVPLILGREDLKPFLSFIERLSYNARNVDTDFYLDPLLKADLRMKQQRRLLAVDEKLRRILPDMAQQQQHEQQRAPQNASLTDTTSHSTMAAGHSIAKQEEEEHVDDDDVLMGV